MNYTSVSDKNWVLKNFDEKIALKISEEFALNEMISRLLAIKKIELQDIELFLKPTIKNYMPNPNQITDMEVAVNRTLKGILNSETIGIFGDYDVDGATSTALIAKYFSAIKHPIYTYIPDRKNEGYGPNKKGIKQLIENNCRIIFTVDCGTSSFDAIDFSQNEGSDIIVLDHHQADTSLPNACAVINPNRVDDKSELNYLCAAGVCLMFLVALNKKLRDTKWFEKNNISEPNIINFLDLVCLGTVCDVVPLVGLNRAIVSQGLKILKKRNNLGLKTLYDLCNIGSSPTTYHLGYIIGPRINAGGRVGKSSHGSDLLISNDPQKTFQIATELNNYNIQRQKIESILLKEVDLEAQKNLDNPVLVLSGDDWHEGIIGIVASRIKDKYNKPTILISFTGNEGKGSARSVHGFDIGTMIISAVQSNILKKGGGHKMAGGFSIEKNNFHKFKEFIIKKFNKLKFTSNNNKYLFIDAILSPSALNEVFFEEIYTLSPFGPGNSEPKFIIENLKVVHSTILSEKHYKVILSGINGQTINAIAFNSKGTELETYLSKSYKKTLNIAGKMTLNEWRGKKNIEFIIDDISVNKV